jgi:uncharacterized protein (TIGR03067 family)
MNKLLPTLAVFASVCGLASAEDKTKPGDKPPALNGSYTIVSGEENGKPIPKERIEGALIVFTDKTVVGTDKDKKQFFSSTYTIDSSKTPWVITMTDAGRGAKPDDKKAEDRKPDDKKPDDKKSDDKKQSASGLIKVDGEMVTVIYALPGGKAPTEFKTADMQQMFVMKRADKK